MIIRHHHTVELSQETKAWLGSVIGVLLAEITPLKHLGERLMALQDSLVALVASIAALKTTDEGMEALLVGLTQKIANLHTVNTDVTTAAAIDALVTEVDQIRGTAAAAIVANTPADPALAPVDPAPVAPPADDVVVTVPVPDPVSVAPAQEAFVAPIPPVGAGAVAEDPAPMVNGQAAPQQPAPLPGATTPAPDAVPASDAPVSSAADLVSALQDAHAAAKAADNEPLA